MGLNKKTGSVMRILISLAIMGLLSEVSATVDTLASEIGSLASNPLESLISETGLKSEFEGISKLVEQVKDGPLGKLTGGKDLKEPLMSPQEPMSLKPMMGTKKLLKTAPLKKVVLKKAVKAKVLVPKVKVPLVALKKKPKTYELEPIVHVIEKPVPVYHKVPVPKKVMVPKFYPVYKPIPVPKIVPVPFKVPVKKIIPKIVKIPKPFIVKKYIPVKKPIPIGIPYPVPKIYKVPIPKPVPYPKFIPIPIKKKECESKYSKSPCHKDV